MLSISGTRAVSSLALAFLTAASALRGQQAAEPVPATALQPPTSIERSFENNEVHPYTVELEAGTYLHVSLTLRRGAGMPWMLAGNLAVTVYDSNGAVVAEVDSVYAGPEVAEIEAVHAGMYRLELRPIWGAGLPYELRVEVRTASRQKAVRDARREAADSAGAWIREHAIPLATVEAGHGFADLQPLRGLVGDARIVALGEATHGTREFFQLKHRILEFLVSELGFDVFAIEATLPEAMDVNRYVLTGEGDPERALAGMYFWTWDTEEVLALIRWMRRYNEDPGHRRKVEFYGVAYPASLL